ncbi:MAG: PRC-barrel domain-containing protein [Coriobacteriia bacterium]
MPRVSGIIGREVVSSKDQILGTVAEVLFAPSEPRAIGLTVERPRVAGVVAKAPRYVPLESVALRERRVELRTVGLPPEAKTEKVIGVTWEETVQWRGMPVVAPSGRVIGVIMDIDFERPSGQVTALELSSGVLGDAAVGRLTVSGDVVLGYADDAVRVSVEYSDLEVSGGAAKVAAAGVATVKDKGGKLAKGAYDVGMTAAIAVGRSFKHGRAKRAVDGLRKMVSDATGDDDE